MSAWQGSVHPQAVTLFDFDRTLTTADTLRVFFKYLAGRRGVSRAALKLMLKAAVPAPSRAFRDQAKEFFAEELLSGVPEPSAEAAAIRTAETVVASLLRPDVVDRLRYHQHDGDRIVIVSASFDSYVRRVAEFLGVSDVVATRWEVDQRSLTLTGRLNGANVRGAGKCAALDAYLPDQRLIRYAYGDSAGDREMLALAQRAVWVTKRTRLPSL